jgi:hypothetical protein
MFESTAVGEKRELKVNKLKFNTVEHGWPPTSKTRA